MWLGHPVSAHWGIEDPAAVQGSALEQKAAFVQALGYLRNRIAAFIALPLQRLEPAALRAQLAAIGASDGVSAGVADQRESRHD